MKYLLVLSVVVLLLFSSGCSLHYTCRLGSNQDQFAKRCGHEVRFKKDRRDLHNLPNYQRGFDGYNIKQAREREES